MKDHLPNTLSKTRPLISARTRPYVVLNQKTVLE